MAEEDRELTLLDEVQAATPARWKETEQVVMVPLSQLPESPLKADAGLTESIRVSGVRQPVILSHDGKKVLAGKRRIAAARAVLTAESPVRTIYAPAEGGAVLEAFITLTENWHRSRNIAAEADALANLIAHGQSPKQIAAAFKVTLSSVNRLLRLRQIPARLYQALKDGKLAPSVADAVAQLPVPTQQQLAENFTAKGKLSADDVRQSRSAVKQNVTGALPADMFGGTSARELGATAAPTSTAVDNALETIVRGIGSTPLASDQKAELWDLMEQVREELAKHKVCTAKPAAAA